MLKLLSDEDFNGVLFRALLTSEPRLDVIRVQDIGLRTALDPDILEWAARQGRILLTRDRATMPGYAYDCVRAGLAMPGVFVTRDDLPIGQQVHEILILAFCSLPAEWANRIVYLPL